MIAVCKSIHHGVAESEKETEEGAVSPVSVLGEVESAAVADVHDIAILHDVVLTF